MKLTSNGHKYPNFSVKESRTNLSQSITEIFKFKEWPHLIWVQVNKYGLALIIHWRVVSGIKCQGIFPISQSPTDISWKVKGEQMQKKFFVNDWYTYRWGWDDVFSLIEVDFDVLHEQWLQPSQLKLFSWLTKMGLGYLPLPPPQPLVTLWKGEKTWLQKLYLQ